MGIHIIHKQKVNLTISRAADSFAIQNRLSRILKDELPKALEPLFNKFSPNGKSLRIEKLSIDLGTISEENLESEFGDRLLEQLTSSLANIVAGSKDTLITEVSEEQSLIDALIYYLEHGYLPWYSMVKDFRVWETTILQAFSGNEWDELIQFLIKRLLISDTPVERLTIQFSEKFIQTVWMKIHENSTNNRPTVSDDLHNLLQLVKADIALLPARSRSRFYQAAIKASLLAKNENDLLFEVISGIFLRWDLFRIQQGGISSFTQEKTTSLSSSVRKKLLLKIKTLKGKISSEEILKVLSSLHQVLDESPMRSVYQKNPAVRNEDNITNKIEPLSGKIKKADKNESLSEEGIFCENCGIVILHPFLQMFYMELGLLNDHFFKDEFSRHRAVFLLHYLATGVTSANEPRLILPKLLCATEFGEPLPSETDLTEIEKESCYTLLKSVLNHWKPLRNTSIGGLQQTFLQREGKLTKTATGWKLDVEQKTVDILLDKLPWGFSTFRLPWMEQILNVDWR